MNDLDLIEARLRRGMCSPARLSECRVCRESQEAIDALGRVRAALADKTVDTAYHQLREVASGAYCALSDHADPKVEREARAIGDVLYAQREQR